jgi:CheY-like chemotaxis protein
MSQTSSIVIVAGLNSGVLDTISRHFEHLGLYTVKARDGAEAEDRAAAMTARIVILDLERPLQVEDVRPEQEACRACARIRALPGYESVPIILLASSDLPRQRIAAQKAGASVILVKPFSLSALMQEIDRFVIDPDGPPRRPDRHGATRFGGVGERPSMQIWKPNPSLAWNFGQHSKLAESRRFLESLRRNTPTTRRS